MIADYKRCFLTCDSSSQGIRSSKGRKRALFQPLNPSPEKLTIKYFSFCRIRVRAKIKVRLAFFSTRLGPLNKHVALAMQKQTRND